MFNLLFRMSLVWEASYAPELGDDGRMAFKAIRMNQTQMLRTWHDKDFWRQHLH
ncbi:MAG: hypothetical protein IIA61_14630 [Candidatus Marinimicrobia bacterium]|nr:hypothetical protein [Candidatus Neomarinimicrobiota bacterium]